ncbi:putative nucleotide-sugar transporter [Aspergillus clavatus NRRL 1]|uniref:Nucleotide-sugar transporter, putative n=1 Tax=Aspergillus clavatus (strain ATCC 1007 / CBS 513.65 / DSM 816 / NCTC 3887 / NRRL 1 / QM 1276 / 107) TaxID=344612 RepID=A1C8L3_ASPCL|nr:nucleotide-sugar transporter, putative [Aspergillus clavatus NRRL 1]EAW13650.1 nucleotide-sugar transporter, putative [Aspergillus clavatus NRRL 1]
MEFSFIGQNKATFATLVVLLLLLLQNTSSITLQHKIQSQTTEDKRFEPLAGIILSELLKLIVSVLYVVQSHRSSPTTFKSTLSALRNGQEEAAIPALLYTAASFAQSIGASYLTLLPYLALSQVKIIITPLLATFLIQQKFTLYHWLFLSMMTAGIVLAQVGAAADLSTTAAQSTHIRLLPGILSMLFAGSCVALGSICMEKSLKRTNCFFVRNAQLAAHSLVFALLSYVGKTRSDFTTFFDGFDARVWLFVVLQASGGFLVAWCVQITSTVTKNYVQGLGFAMAAALPLAMTRAGVNYQLLGGVGLVIGSVFGSAIVGHRSRSTGTVEKVDSVKKSDV